jgi:glycosyltransferase involved in cell wall biosynthesis
MKISLRVLLTIHHRLDPNLGGPGVTLALAKALGVAGCEVTTYGYQEAWPHLREPSVKHAVAFPYKTAAYLARNHNSFDILDMSTGDAHWWPLAKRLCRTRPVLITRSHGLEHLAAESVRSDAAHGAIHLSRKYGIYHGGIRLHEVARSLRTADGAIVLNDVDRDYAINRIGVKADCITVIPNGVPQDFIEAQRANAGHGPLRLVWLATWLPRKGMHEMIDALDRLADASIDCHLLMLGTSVAAEDVLTSIPERMRSCVTVVPHFVNTELPSLLADREVFVFPSHFEGFSMALVETMALGVAPIATAVGGAPTLIEPNVNGVLIPTYDATALADAITRMAANREATWAMGRRARETARNLTWDRVAEKTLQWYQYVRELTLTANR